MVKLCIAVILALVLVGRGGKSITVKTEIQKVYVPVLQSPKPPVIPRPGLPIHELDETVISDGEIVKVYKATVFLLLRYANALEEALKEYDRTHEALKEQENLLRNGPSSEELLPHIE